jgi:hypothetical protein
LPFLKIFPLHNTADLGATLSWMETTITTARMSNEQVLDGYFSQDDPCHSLYDNNDNKSSLTGPGGWAQTDGSG